MQVLTVQVLDPDRYKQCEVCGSIISRAAMSTRGSRSITHWKHRRFCSVKCRYIGQGSEFHNNTKRVSFGGRGGSKQYYRCWKCGIIVVGSRAALRKHKDEKHSY